MSYFDKVGLLAGDNNIGNVDIVTIPAVDLGATDNAVLDDIAAQATTVAGAVAGGHMQVDVLTGGGAGEQYADGAAVDAGYKGNIVLGTDGTNYQAIATDSSGNVQVELASAIPAGTNAIGKLAANTGVDIGDVDILSIAAGDNNIGNVDIVSGTITAVTSITNVVHVDDNAGALTVDGTVTAELSATDNAVLDAIAVDTGVIAGDTTSIDGKLPALGQALAAASIPVVLTAAQMTTLTPVAAITNFANETGGNLAAIKAKTDNIPALGQALAAASVPVVLPSATITTLTPPAAITGFATSAKQLADNHQVTVSNIANTPVITGFATETTLGTVHGHVDSIDGKITACNTGAIVGTVTANLSATDNAVLDDIAANQTDASQKTQIVDGSGNVIGATSNALDVNIKSGASAGTEYTEDAAAAANPVGGALIMVRDDALSGQTTTDGDNVAARGTDKGELYVKHVDEITAALSATDNAVLDTIDAAIDAINAKMVTGTDIGDVTINNSTGVAAVNIQDGGNTITVDGTVGITANSSVNVAQMNGVNTTMGNGTSGTGVQRVTIASDSTGQVKLAAGTAAIGKLTANSGVDIGDVDVTSLPVGHNIIDSGTVTTITNVVHVDDNAGALTVDGTVTANLSATDNAVLDAIQAAVETIDNMISGSEAQVDIVTMPAVSIAQAAITGYGQAKLDHANVTTAQAIVAAVADKKFYITSITISASTAGNYWIEDDDAAQITNKFYFAANGGCALTFPIDTPYKSTTANKGLKLKGSAAGAIGCMITYYTLA